ncbi:NAD(P)H-binding protein [Paenibacillus nasutitermitis]|uniref:NAD(P)H-binding protein n=1 Tax=Paenibacillus nasutitermitis TaxID=1652958 RepID=UPI001662F781|nr:NAD(P)H-binding protein [Paenibacillus nasutitermitis]
MKLVVFGASGRTGRHIVDLAIQNGHIVTGFVRSRSSLPLSHPNLVVVEGDILHSELQLRDEQEDEGSNDFRLEGCGCIVVLEAGDDVRDLGNAGSSLGQTERACQLLARPHFLNWPELSPNT